MDTARSNHHTTGLNAEGAEIFAKDAEPQPKERGQLVRGLFVRWSELADKAVRAPAKIVEKTIQPQRRDARGEPPTNNILCVYRVSAVPSGLWLGCGFAALCPLR